MAVNTRSLLLSPTTTGIEKARFEFLMRKWRRSLLNNRVAGQSIISQKAFVNNWLLQFEEIFRNQQASINILSGYTGFISASVGSGVETSIDAFLTQYRDTVQALSSKDLVQARGLRNSIAIRVRTHGVKNIYSDFLTFDKEARALGLTGRERVDGFLNTLGKDYTTIITESRAGRIMHWKPDKYARMYSDTRDSQLRDELFQDQLVEIGSDVVQVSSHGTTTPICQQFEGFVFSLTGKTQGLPVLSQRPGFHPGCKHVLLSRPKMSMRDARKNNFFKNKDLAKERAKYTTVQINAMQRQKDWNLENRPPKASEV
jgi:hypothetical protein